jgi:hypothetical protein
MKLDLDFDLTQTSTEMPRLVAGDYLCKVKSAEIEENSRKDGHNLKVTFSTLEEGESTEGDAINPGFPLTKWFPLQQSSNDKAPPFERDLAILTDAVFKIEDPEDRPPFTNDLIDKMHGEEVVIRAKLRNSEDFGLQNDVARIMPAE